MVNYNIAYSKMANKYLFKAFYNRINKKNTTYKFDSIIYAILI